MNTRWHLVAMVFVVAACPSESGVFDQVQTDSWTQAPNNQVDILWVIDNSNSMAEEQSTLVAGFTSFASQIEASGTDFHIGVLTTSFDYTDPDRGKLIGDPPYLTNADDYEAQFALRSLVGVGGSDKEKGYESATFAVHPSMTLPGGPNEGFVRTSAELLIVFVSDEQDCSDNGALEGQPPVACYSEVADLWPVTDYVGQLRGLKADPAMVQISAIVGTNGSTCPNVVPGTRYMSGAALTGGTIGDICQNDWSSMLGDLGHVATGIRTRFQLSKAAKPETIEVFVNDEPVETGNVAGWTYDEATWFLEFHDEGVPPRGAAIRAKYTVQPGVVAPTGSGV